MKNSYRNDNQTIQKERVKICILGDNGVGKRSFAGKFGYNLFEEDFLQKIGADFYVRKISLGIDAAKIDIKLHLWVLTGEKRFKFLIPHYFRDASGFIIVFDLSSNQSFNNIPNWIDLIVSSKIPRPILLVGNKIDLERKVSNREIRTLVNKYKLHYVEISTKEGKKVEAAFNILTCLIFNYEIPEDVIKNNFLLIPQLTQRSVAKLKIEEFSANEFKQFESDLIEAIKEITLSDKLTIAKNLIHNLKKSVAKKYKQRVGLLKGHFLEMDARKVLKREYNYDIDDDTKNLNAKDNDSLLLFQNSCSKDINSKNIEIDVFGFTWEDNVKTYILGECKAKSRNLTKGIKCFLLKASIIAKHYNNTHEKEGIQEPKFHLLIISLAGFPKNKKLKEIIKNYLNIPKNRLVNNKIELIDRDEFIKLLKKHDIPTHPYQMF